MDPDNIWTIWSLLGKLENEKLPNTNYRLRGQRRQLMFGVARPQEASPLRTPTKGVCASRWIESLISSKTKQWELKSIVVIVFQWQSIHVFSLYLYFTHTHTHLVPPQKSLDFHCLLTFVLFWCILQDLFSFFFACVCECVCCLCVCFSFFVGPLWSCKTIFVNTSIMNLIWQSTGCNMFANKNWKSKGNSVETENTHDIYTSSKTRENQTTKKYKLFGEALASDPNMFFGFFFCIFGLDLQATNNSELLLFLEVRLTTEDVKHQKV